MFTCILLWDHIKVLGIYVGVENLWTQIFSFKVSVSTC